jgi:hypothetical protein
MHLEAVPNGEQLCGAANILTDHFSERSSACRTFLDHQLAFTFVTGDTPLIAAAQAEALLTDNPSITFIPAISPDPLSDHTAESRHKLSGQLRPPASHLHSFSFQCSSHGLKQT